jgi:hypothetical protein
MQSERFEFSEVYELIYPVHNDVFVIVAAPKAIGNDFGHDSSTEG